MTSGAEENRAGDGPEAGVSRLHGLNGLKGEQFDDEGRISHEARPAVLGRGHLASALKWMPLSRDCRVAKTRPIMVVTGFIEGRYERLAHADVYIGSVTDVLLSSNKRHWPQERARAHMKNGQRLDRAGWREDFREYG